MNYKGKQNAIRIGCVALMLLAALPAQTQYRQEPGHSIGTVTRQGNLIILTLDPDVLGKANLFDLAHHTLRFTPEDRAIAWKRLPRSGTPSLAPRCPAATLPSRISPSHSPARLGTRSP